MENGLSGVERKRTRRWLYFTVSGFLHWILEPSPIGKEKGRDKNASLLLFIAINVVRI